MIEVYNIGELKDLTAWLEQYVKPRLGSDVSGYARGRRRAWLGTEPALTDSYKAAYQLELRLLPSHLQRRASDRNHSAP